MRIVEQAKKMLTANCMVSMALRIKWVRLRRNDAASPPSDLHIRLMVSQIMSELMTNKMAPIIRAQIYIEDVSIKLYPMICKSVDL